MRSALALAHTGPIAVRRAQRELEASGKAEGLYEQWFGQKSSLKMDKRAFKFETDKVAE